MTSEYLKLNRIMNIVWHRIDFAYSNCVPITRVNNTSKMCAMWYYV